MAIALTLLLVLLAAAAVLVGVAALVPHDGGRPPFETLRSALADVRRRRSTTSAGAPGTGTATAGRPAPSVAVAEPVDVSMADLLRATTERGEAYLRVDELAAGLQKASERAQERTTDLLAHVRRG